jgi:hypothetical protein
MSKPTPPRHLSTLPFLRRHVSSPISAAVRSRSQPSGKAGQRRPRRSWIGCWRPWQLDVRPSGTMGSGRQDRPVNGGRRKSPARRKRQDRSGAFTRPDTGYPLSGCPPVEPDSVPPGKPSLAFSTSRDTGLRQPPPEDSTRIIERQNFR